MPDMLSRKIIDGILLGVIFRRPLMRLEVVYVIREQHMQNT